MNAYIGEIGTKNRNQKWHLFDSVSPPWNPPSGASAALGARCSCGVVYSRGSVFMLCSC